jgi:hypothetical protein
MRAKFWLERQKRRDHSEEKRRRWEGIIKMDLREIGFEGVSWIYITRDPCWILVNMVMNLLVP